MVSRGGGGISRPSHLEIGRALFLYPSICLGAQQGAILKLPASESQERERKGAQ